MCQWAGHLLIPAVWLPRCLRCGIRVDKGFAFAMYHPKAVP